MIFIATALKGAFIMEPERREDARGFFARTWCQQEAAAHGPLQPVALTPIGYYAYKITWNDGHDTGLYTLETLRQLCECPQCRSQGS